MEFLILKKRVLDLYVKNFKVSKKGTGTVSMALCKHQINVLNDMVNGVFKFNKKGIITSADYCSDVFIVYFKCMQHNIFHIHLVFIFIIQNVCRISILFFQGCVDAIPKFMKDHMWQVGGVDVGLAFVQVGYVRYHPFMFA